MVPIIADKIEIFMAVTSHGCSGNVVASTCGSSFVANRLSGVESTIAPINKVYRAPTRKIEYVSALGMFFSGFFTQLNSDAAHSKPKKPKMTTRVASKTFSSPYGANGVNRLTFIFVRDNMVIARIGSTVQVIKILCPS